MNKEFARAITHVISLQIPVNVFEGEDDDIPEAFLLGEWEVSGINHLVVVLTCSSHNHELLIPPDTA